MIKDSMYLYGKNSVFERLKADPKSIRKIFLEKGFNAQHILSVINSKNIPVKRVNERELERIKRADRLQGIVAEVDSFRYTEFEELLHKGRNNSLSFIFLDNTIGHALDTKKAQGDGIPHALKEKVMQRRG